MSIVIHSHKWRSIVMLPLLSGALWERSLPLEAQENKNSPPPPLLEAATKLCDAASWTGEPVYLWLSERKVLSWQVDSKKNSRNNRWIHKERYKAIVIDLNTGKEQPLTAFNKRWNQQRGFSIAPLLSPDGKWMLGFATRDIMSWFALSLDGSRVIDGGRGDMSEYSGKAWTADSLHWITVYNGGVLEADQFSLQKPQNRRQILVAGMEGLIKRGPNHIFLIEGHSVETFTMLGFTPAGRGLLRISPREEQGNMLLWEVGFEPKADPPRLIRISIPKEARIDQVVLSPTGDRLAWRFKYFHALPTNQVDKSARTEIWISRVDGSEMHLLGVQTVKDNDSTYDYNDSEIPCRLAWVPGGKRLSFLYKNSLYTLPVE